MSLIHLVNDYRATFSEGHLILIVAGRNDTLSVILGGYINNHTTSHIGTLEDFY
jgi:hypothetical protein